ncbi:hypothetical protein JX266_007914 [Neoarthrinium moseri]|nr:hypothetical protein JX266_007914 [Neoarthrinium moseri]
MSSIPSNYLVLLSPTSLTGTGLGLFVLWYILSSVVAWYRLRHIPGPFIASFSYLWHMRNIFLGCASPEHIALKRYGSLVRTGPNYVVTDDPNILRLINGARSSWPRDSWYTSSRFDPNYHMLSLLDTAAHDTIKAKLTSGYSGRDVQIENGVNTQIEFLVETIRSRYLSTSTRHQPTDLAQVIRYFTLDVITHLSYGTSFGFLAAEQDLYDYTNSVDRFIRAITLSVDIPLFRWIAYSPLLTGIMPKASDKSGMGKLIGIGQKIVNERFQDNEKHTPDMLGSFMRHGATREECVSETMLTLIAGSDTTATAIRSTMLYLISTPRVYNRLKAEIQEAASDNRVSSPIGVDEAKRLPYLQAVILEGFRMRPPVVYGQYKAAPPGGETINGVFIPGGTAVGQNAVAMMRSEKAFGAGVDLFRPERFLECSEEARREMERTVDLVFGTGRWMCAGRTVAWVELNKIFFELLRAFDFQPIYPTKPVDEESYALFTHKNMWVAITETA